MGAVVGEKITLTIEAAIEARLPLVIVDDIVTTGSTVMACARACRRAGAARLFVAAVAHG